MDLSWIKFDIPRGTKIIRANCIDEQVVEWINTRQGEQSKERVDYNLEDKFSSS
jgi:hypothetical protein